MDAGRARSRITRARNPACGPAKAGSSSCTPPAAVINIHSAGTVWLSVRTLPGGALVVWPETLSQTPWLINKSAGGPPF